MLHDITDVKAFREVFVITFLKTDFWRTAPVIQVGTGVMFQQGALVWESFWANGTAKYVPKLHLFRLLSMNTLYVSFTS
jgi:hypothetical protein